MASPLRKLRALASPALIPAVLALLLLGMAKKQVVTVRFFAEANKLDSEKFASPVQLTNPPRPAFLEKIPAVSERQIKAIYPFQAADGSWGCAFKLNDSGRINLEVVSTERRGSALVAFVQTKTGTHQVIDLLIDKPVRDGIISIPRGLTELEIGALSKEYPVIGDTKRKQRPDADS